MATKAELRKQALQQRQQLSLEQVQQAGQQVCDRFFDIFDLQAVHCLHIFLSIVEKRELDTWPIIRQVWKQHKHVQVAVPVTPPGALHLQHRLLTPTTELIRSKWGIEEPSDESPEVPEQKVDLVLVPMLAFDRLGHRVGYGKGYYDRFLARCRPDVLKVGLSLFEPVAPIADAGPHDMPLDWCLTPERVYRFT